MNIFKYGDDINTDLIIPARYLNVSDPALLAEHCMEDEDKTFAKTVKKGDILIGGNNFGCGSSREHAPIAIKASGISVVIAKSFARIFYRNAINIGLYIIESPEAVEDIDVGDQVEVNYASGQIHNLTKNKTYQATPFPPFIRTIVEKGGLLACIKEFGGNHA